jgi:AcrR family transcriptional regulator
VAVSSRIRTLTPARIPSRSSKHRLSEALSTLTTTEATHRATVSTLCRLAGVSRNTLYRYYPDVAAAVCRLRRCGGTHRRRLQQNTLKSVRWELTQLRTQLSQLATLAHHYFTAAEELRALLVRRDRELAALRDSVRPKSARGDPAPTSGIL